MARFDVILVAGQKGVTKIATLGATSASNPIAIGPNVPFAINATDACHLAFGHTSGVAATAANFRIPKEQTLTFDTGTFSYIRVYNPGASAIAVYIFPLCVS